MVASEELISGLASQLSLALGAVNTGAAGQWIVRAGPWPLNTGAVVSCTVTTWLRRLDDVLAILPEEEDELEDELRELLDERLAARARKDWAESDRLRDELMTRGIAVEDTRDGQRWRRLVEAGRG